ncbi:MAG TPA: hypothetical protein VGF30_15625 [Bacteroidia bacterium]
MLHAAKISARKTRNSILAYGFVASLLYAVFLLTMKMVNLMHVTELRMVNYVILFFVCMIQIKRWITKTGAYVPFLKVFTMSFFTGIFSFLVFNLFLYIYTQFDVELNKLFIETVAKPFQFQPTVVIMLEGSAISIIVAFINMQFFRRYEEGEVSPKKERAGNV